MSRKAKPAQENKFDAVHPAAADPLRKLWYREAIIFLGTFIFFYIFADMGIDPHHDGVMLIPAIRVAQGGMVFKDVFCQYGLLVPLIQGLAVAIFGEELLVIRLVTVLFYGGCAILLDLLWRRFLPAKISWLVPVLFALLSPATMVTFHSWSSVYALFFMLLSGFFLLRYLEDHKWGRWNLFAAGSAAILTWGCRTPCGAVTVFAAILVLAGLNLFTGKTWKTLMQEWFSYAAGCALIALPALACIIFTGAWDDFIKQNFGYVADFVQQRGNGGEIGSWQYFCDSMLPFFQDDFLYCHTFFALMPLGAIALLYIHCRKGIISGKEEMKKILPLTALLILGLGSWHQYYPVPCVRHLFWGGAPLFGAYILIIIELWKFQKNITGKAAAIFMGLFLLLAIYPRITGGYIRLLTKSSRKTLDVSGIRGIKLSNSERNLIRQIRNTVENDPLKERGVVNWSEDSLLTLMMPGSGFHDVQFYRFDNKQYPDYDQKILRHIEEKRPFVLVDHPTIIPGYKPVLHLNNKGKEYMLLRPEE